MTLALTGATGHLGGFVLDHLLQRGTPADQIVALVRDPAKAAGIAARGVVVRQFDYDQPDTLAAALDQVSSLLLISGTAFGRRATQHAAVIDAAKAAGVGRVVYTSAPHVEDSVNPVSPEHKVTEEYLAASGLAYAVLRNGWYNENFFADLDAAAATGQLLTAAGDGLVSSAARTDFAEAAAVVLAGDQTGTFALNGDTAWSQAELAATLSEVLRRPVELHQVSPAEKADLLSEAGVDPAMIGFAVGIDQAIAAGELGDTTGELAALIGHATTALMDTLRARG